MFPEHRQTPGLISKYSVSWEWPQQTSSPISIIKSVVVSYSFPFIETQVAIWVFNFRAHSNTQTQTLLLLIGWLVGCTPYLLLGRQEQEENDAILFDLFDLLCLCLNDRLKNTTSLLFFFPHFLFVLPSVRLRSPRPPRSLAPCCYRGLPPRRSWNAESGRSVPPATSLTPWRVRAPEMLRNTAEHLLFFFFFFFFKLNFLMSRSRQCASTCSKVEYMCEIHGGFWF